MPGRVALMNGGLRGSRTISPLKNVDQMDISSPYRNGIPKDLPNRTKDNHWIGGEDEMAAEETLSEYCKPVELYNMIQRRFSEQPLFLQRCLSYKIQAARQRRLKMSVSVTGFIDSFGQLRGSLVDKISLKDPDPNVDLLDCQTHSVFAMVTTPVSHLTKEGQLVYRRRRSKVITVGGSQESLFGSGAQADASFILPEIRKVVQNAKKGDVVLFMIFAQDGLNRGQLSVANCSGRVIWGKMAMSSLCMNWLKSTKENHDSISRSLGGRMLESTLNVDLRHGKLQHDDSTDGPNIIFVSSTKMANERSLVQLVVRISAGEVGQINAGVKNANEIFPRSPLPYSLSHAWRTRVGRVVFHYLYAHGMRRKTEVTEEFSCPFCLSRCASFKGLRHHLDATHDLFTFEYLVSGELQVVNVSCRSDVLGPQGNIRDLDGLSDPRLKNFAYWYKASPHRRRRISTSSKEQLVDKDVEDIQISDIEGISEIVVAEDPAGSSDVQDIDAGLGDGLEASVEEASVGATQVSDAADQQLLEVESLAVSGDDEISNGISSTSVSEGVGDGIQTMDLKEGDRTSFQQHELKSRIGKFPNDENLGLVVKQRSVSAQKRQRMKGVLGERALARARPNSTLGGACAAAAGAAGDSIEDCAVQQGLSLSHKATTDRPDISRSHALLQRQFFHSHTAQPMDADQLLGDRDSEDEVDAVIADFEDRRMLDDFVDVTAEEKEVMHLWNSFVRRNRVLADGHCPWACKEFSTENAQQFGANPALRRCLMLFLVKLWNHHLVDGATIDSCLSIVDSFEPKVQGLK